jgi:hypothetical protein
MPLDGKLKGKADLVICVDCTGSMEPCIEGLKKSLEELVEGLSSPNLGGASVDWRLRVLGFRDLTVDKEPWVNKGSPMVNNVADAKAQIQALVHAGGGDLEESHLDALWVAAHETDWDSSPRTKVIAFFSDAPTHPEMHPDTVALGAAGNDVSAVLQKLGEVGKIHIFAWIPKCPEWEAIAKDRPHVQIQWQPMDGNGLQHLDYTDLIQKLAATVTDISTADAGGGETKPIS